MSLYNVSTGSVINTNDLNQVVNILQAPSGAQELGKYFLTFNASAGGYFGSVWVTTLSRGVSPVSVSIDTSIASPVNCGNLGTGNLTTAGFQITAQSASVSSNCRVAGAYVVQY